MGAVVGSLVTLAACTRAVPVDEPDLSSHDEAVCHAVMADLPEVVGGLNRRETDPGIVSAAWGSPPVTLRCGVTQPQELTATSECLEVNGVGWFDEPGTGGRVFTTVGRATFIEVSVPDEYPPQAAALTYFSDVISTHDPLHTPCV